MKTCLLIASTAIVLVLARCSPSVDEAEKVKMDQIADTDVPPPENVSGMGLGALAPASKVAFCEAVTLTPVRWLTCTVVPLQYWVSTFESVVFAPGEAAAAVAGLVDYGNRRLAWQFGADVERPPWGEEQIADSMVIAAAAITTCPDLPLVAGLPGTSDPPAGWRELDTTAIARRCTDD